ncbi:MAG TPA: tetratricopeptide repeat protein [Candidatus Udaeobacter sp.]|nr:tetratricopeptide repeat protein [Candidatus Udaeobacter sp.]
MNVRSFFAELKRRNVYKVAIAYGIVAWLLAQIATQTFPFFEIPNWMVRAVIVLLLLGFPIALVIAWAFELTPEGIKRTEDVDLSKSIRHTTGRKLDFFIIAVLLLVIGILLFQRLHPNVSPTVSSALAKSIAVLPFDNLSRDPDNAYFSDGIQDEIVTKLAGIGDLKVISRKSTAKYKSTPEDLKTVARELGVASVLEGSVQRAGDRVRVNVQLLDARIDTHLWAKSYDRDLKDVFAVESEVAQEIADTLRAKLSPGQSDALAAAPTRDTEAYDLFLKGEYEQHQAESALSAELFDRAQTFYRQALARDPNFALAYARLAYTELYRHWFISDLTSEELAEVKPNIDRALAIAPGLADAHFALGLFYYWGHRDYDPALREVDRAIELQPSSSDSWNVRASIHRRRGEWQRALAEFERAAELNPRDSRSPGEIGNTYTTLRRWSDAEHELTRALALDPHNAPAATYLARYYVNSTGDIRRARQAFEGAPADREIIGPSGWGDVAAMVDERVYLDVFEKHFADALRAWDTLPTNLPEARLHQLMARVGIQVLAGQAAKPECEQTRALLESRLAERPEDRISLTALAWVYVCLGRNADAVRVARQAADLLPIEKDALAGPIFLAGLAEIEARTGKPKDAIKILRQLITAPAGGVVSIARLKIDTVWDPIRNDPDFQKLLSEPEPVTIYK